MKKAEYYKISLKDGKLITEFQIKDDISSFNDKRYMTDFFYLKTSKLYYIFTSRIIYDPNALARDHVNSFWDTSTPICQTESLTGIYTGPDAGRLNN